MASFNTRLFKNTGFDINNIPDRADLLDSDNITKLDVDAIWVFQNQELGKIRIKTNFQDVYSVDYCRIGTSGNNLNYSYYFVTNVTMINPVTAELDLQIDPITSIGLKNITDNIMDGWCVRRSVTDDTLFSNCIDEDFTPTQPLEHETQDLTVAKDGMLAIISTIDLMKVNERLSQGYKESIESTEIDVHVPTVPVIDPTEGYTTVTIDYEGLQLTRELVGKRMYLYTTLASLTGILSDALTTVWSLGLSDAIAGIYYLPIDESQGSYFNYDVEYFDSSPAVKKLTVYGKRTTINNIPFKWNTADVKNNKVFASRYNKYTLLSMVSGNKAEYYAGEIYDSANKPNAPSIAINLDPSDDGTTYARPEYIRGIDLSQTSKKFEIIRDAVTGGDFNSANIVMNRPKGITKTLNALNWDEAMFTLSSAADIASNMMGVNTANLSNGYREFTTQAVNLNKGGYFDKTPLMTDVTTSDFGGSKMSVPVISNIGNFINSLFNYRAEKGRMNQRKANAIIQSPDTWFPISNTLSLFFGNSYFVIRERLSDTDTIKFDRYLTAYGYSVNEPLTKDCFYGRLYFNYLQCENLSLGKLNVGTQTGNIQECPLRLKNAAIAMLEGGIRIWHTPVLQSAFRNNPIVNT